MANEYLYGAYGHIGETVAQSAVQAGTTPVYIGTAPVNLVRDFDKAGIINAPVIFTRIYIFAGLVVAALAVMISFLDRCSNFRVCGVAAHVFAPCGETVLCACHVLDECTCSPRKRAVVCNEKVMAVTVTADAFVAVLISGNLNVI